MNAYLRAAVLYKSQLYPLDVRHWTSFLWLPDNNRSIFPRCLIKPSLTVKSHSLITTPEPNPLLLLPSPICKLSQATVLELLWLATLHLRIQVTRVAMLYFASSVCLFFSLKVLKGMHTLLPCSHWSYIPIVKPWSLAHHLLEKDLQIWPWSGLV